MRVSIKTDAHPHNMNEFFCRKLNFYKESYLEELIHQLGFAEVAGVFQAA
jgi:hypothetical protein